MRPSKVRSALFAALVTLGACAPAGAPSSDSPLSGAWRLLDVTVFDTTGKAGPDLAAKGLLLVSGNHYSLAWSDTTGHAGAFAKTWVSTDSEKIARFEVFLANAGSFENSHDTLTIHPSSAKNPSYEGGKGQYTFKVTGDTLAITLFDIQALDGTPIAAYRKGVRERQRFLRLK